MFNVNISWQVVSRCKNHKHLALRRNFHRALTYAVSTCTHTLGSNKPLNNDGVMLYTRCPYHDYVLGAPQEARLDFVSRLNFTNRFLSSTVPINGAGHSV